MDYIMKWYVINIEDDSGITEVYIDKYDDACCYIDTVRDDPALKDCIIYMTIIEE